MELVWCDAISGAVPASAMDLILTTLGLGAAEVARPKSSPHPESRGDQSMEDLVVANATPEGFGYSFAGSFDADRRGAACPDMSDGELESVKL